MPVAVEVGDRFLVAESVSVFFREAYHLYSFYPVLLREFWFGEQFHCSAIVPDVVEEVEYFLLFWQQVAFVFEVLKGLYRPADRVVDIEQSALCGRCLGAFVGVQGGADDVGLARAGRIGGDEAGEAGGGFVGEAE